MTSSLPATDTQINPSATSIPPINSPISPPELITFNIPPTQHAGTSSQHAGASSQNFLGIYWPPITIPGTNLHFTEPIHHSSISLPTVPFPELIETPVINTPNLNTVTQILNLPSSSIEAMIKNIKT